MNTYTEEEVKSALVASMSGIFPDEVIDKLVYIVNTQLVLDKLKKKNMDMEYIHPALEE